MWTFFPQRPIHSIPNLIGTWHHLGASAKWGKETCRHLYIWCKPGRIALQKALQSLSTEWELPKRKNLHQLSDYIEWVWEFTAALSSSYEICFLTLTITITLKPPIPFSSSANILRSPCPVPRLLGPWDFQLVLTPLLVEVPPNITNALSDSSPLSGHVWAFLLPPSHIKKKTLEKAALLHNKFQCFYSYCNTSSFLYAKSLRKIERNVFLEGLPIFPSFCSLEPLVLSN